MRIVASNPDSIGDFLLRQPLYNALTEAGHELFLVVRERVLPLARCVVPKATLAVLEGDPYSPQIEAQWPKLAPVFQAARGFCPDMLLIVSYQWTLFEERLAEELDGVDTVGFTGVLYAGDPRSGLRSESQLRFARQVAAERDTPELEKNERLAAALLGRAARLLPPSIRANERQLAAGRDLLRRLGVAAGDGYWIACVGHSPYTAVRNWTIEQWAQVLGEWIRRYGRSFVLVGDGGEREACETLRVQLGEQAAGVASALHERSTLDELMGLTHYAQGYVGRDTGPMHVAAALGKPVIAVFGGGTWPRFVPAAERARVFMVGVPCTGCDWVCQFGESYCVKRVPTRCVLEAIEEYEAGKLTQAQVTALEVDGRLSARMLRESADRVREQTRALAALEGRLARDTAAAQAQLAQVRASSDSRDREWSERLARQQREWEESMARELSAAAQRIVQEREQTERAQREREADLRDELARLRGQVTELEARIADREVRLAGAKHDCALVVSSNDQFAAQCEALRREIEAAVQRTGQLAAQQAEAGEAAARYRQFVADLRKSRWRKLGLRLGVARRAAWEPGDEPI